MKGEEQEEVIHENKHHRYEKQVGGRKMILALDMLNF